MSNSPDYSRWSLEPYGIGMKLRALRTQKRLTLSRLSSETGLSTALLSKLETDRMVPTLPTLANICRVYGIGLSYFFSDASEHTISITRKAHLIGGGRSQESVKHTPLNASPNSQLVVEMIEFPPGGAASISEVGRRTTSVVYVLEGRLKLDAGGAQEELDAGDCICLESQIAIAWSAVGKSTCRVLMVSPASPRDVSAG